MSERSGTLGDVRVPRSTVVRAGAVGGLLVLASPFLAACNFGTEQTDTSSVTVEDTLRLDIGQFVNSELLYDRDPHETDLARSLATAIAEGRRKTAYLLGQKVVAGTAKPTTLTENFAALEVEGGNIFGIVGTNLPHVQKDYAWISSCQFDALPPSGKTGLSIVTATVQRPAPTSLDEVSGSQIMLDRQDTGGGEWWKLTTFAHAIDEHPVSGWPTESTTPSQPATSLEELSDMLQRDQFVLGLMASGSPQFV